MATNLFGYEQPEKKRQARADFPPDWMVKLKSAMATLDSWIPEDGIELGGLCKEIKHVGGPADTGAQRSVIRDALVSMGYPVKPVRRKHQHPLDTTGHLTVYPKPKVSSDESEVES